MSASAGNLCSLIKASVLPITIVGLTRKKRVCLTVEIHVGKTRVRTAPSGRVFAEQRERTGMMTYWRNRGACRLAGLVLALVLAVSALMPAGAIADEPPPLISQMPGLLKLACRDAENVEACGYLAAALNAYFKPAFQFERRFAIGAKIALGLQGGGRPSDATCEACVEKVQDVQTYLLFGEDPGGPGLPLLTPGQDDAIETLQSACDRRFRPLPLVEQCRAEVDEYGKIVLDIVLSDYSPLPFCRLPGLAACPPLE